MSHASVAKRVRVYKENFPERYCSHKDCLYNVTVGKCPKHDTPAKLLTKHDAVRILENARMYLAKLPVQHQYMVVDVTTGWLVNPAIPILFNIECGLRYHEGA